MSIKVVHIVFILFAVLISIGFGIWGLHSHITEWNRLHMGLGTSSLVLGVALVAYGLGFLRKMKDLKIS